LTLQQSYILIVLNIVKLDQFPFCFDIWLFWSTKL